MSEYVVLLSIPGLRRADLSHMPQLDRFMQHGDRTTLVPTFPCVTWPVQANMLTGKLPSAHGVVANGFYWRDRHEVEMWTAWNEKITAPQIWDVLHRHQPHLRSAAWFPMLSKGSHADYVCMPAPIHNPDGSESLWCYTKPVELYGALRDRLGDFPLQHFWGPLANIRSTSWIVESAIEAAGQFHPNFFYIYLPHLDYAAQRHGPDSPQAMQSLTELDEVLGRLFSGVNASLPAERMLWLVASEYTITPVQHVSYPNRLLRQAGWLKVFQQEDGEHLDLRGSDAWALVDHQFSHVFVQRDAERLVPRIAALFRNEPGIEEVLVGSDLARYGLDHPRSGELVLISNPESWQAYYWWLDDLQAPAFARTVDIHRKPGYDPVELHFDPVSRGIPLDASLVRGSHGAPARRDDQRGVLLSSQKGVFVETALADTDVADIVLRQFGI
jgi:predicted AlkP superfamily pyrophosphatase or phosphodiesterase